MFEEILAKIKNEDVYLRIKVCPGSRLTEFKEKMADETYKINIAAPAEKGKANQSLLKFLAVNLKIPKNKILIISGAGDRVKLIKISK
jgi:uncharacterized protein (TIGR00251 family)